MKRLVFIFVSFYLNDRPEVKKRKMMELKFSNISSPRHFDPSILWSLFDSGQIRPYFIYNAL